jgi:hypothetical protein
MALTDVWNIVAAALLSVGGAGVIIVALSRSLGQRVADQWLAGIKADYGKQLARIEHELAQLRKRPEGSLDHSGTVNRVQFEEEFRSVREVWKAVARARASAVAIREGILPADDPPDQQRKRFLDACRDFDEALNKLVLAVDDNKPFYPQEIYSAAAAFVRRLRLELIELQIDRGLSKTEWVNQRAVAAEEISKLAEDVSLTIRQRLGSIVIHEAS